MKPNAGTLTHFSLCSGIGGLDLAGEWAGFETIGQCEIDEYASRVLAKNFPKVKNYGDIRTITNELLAADGIKRGDITVLSAGIPCQPYSLAGKGFGDSDVRDLEQELIRVIGELEPEWVVVENTPGLFARKNQQYFNRILTDISSLGYSVGWGMWGACDIGAPHKRDRVFIVAHTNGGRDKGERHNKQEEFLSNTFIRVCGVVSNTAGKQLGLHGSAKEVNEVARGRYNNGIRTEENAVRERWKTEPDMGRVANGVSFGVDKLRCLGNAVVPQQAYPIFKSIAEYETANKQISTIYDKVRQMEVEE